MFSFERGDRTINRSTINSGDRRHIFRRLQASFNLETGHPQSDQFRDLFDPGKILRREQKSLFTKILRPAIHEQLIGQTTCLSALATVRAALAERLAGQTLSRICDTERAVDKNLDRKFTGREPL